MSHCTCKISFFLNRCMFPLVIAKYLGSHFFVDSVYFACVDCSTDCKLLTTLQSWNSEISINIIVENVDVNADATLFARANFFDRQALCFIRRFILVLKNYSSKISGLRFVIKGLLLLATQALSFKLAEPGLGLVCYDLVNSVQKAKYTSATDVGLHVCKNNNNKQNFTAQLVYHCQLKQTAVHSVNASNKAFIS